MTNASVRLGKIWNIPIGLHWSWFIVFILVTSSLALAMFPQSYPGLSTTAYLLLGVVTSLLFFGSVLLHELGHTLLPLRNGVPVREINLFIFGGVAIMEKEPTSAKAEFWIAIAGPLVSLALAILFGALWLVSGDFVYLAAPAFWLAWINFTLAVFNMIPGFPLDGGRVLRAIVWHYKGSLHKATRIASVSGQMLALGFIGFGIFNFLTGNLFGGLWIGLIGWCLLSSAAAALAHTNLEQRLRDVTVGEVMRRQISFINPQTSLQELVDNHLLRGQNRCFLVGEPDAPQGLISLTDVTKIPRENWGRLWVAEVMIPAKNIISISPETGLFNALREMSEKNIAQIFVVEDGKIVGLISREDVFHQINLRTQLNLGGETESREKLVKIALQLEKTTAR